MNDTPPVHPFARLSARGLALVAVAALVPAALFAVYGRWELARDVGFVTLLVYAGLGLGSQIYARMCRIEVGRVYGPPPSTRELLVAAGFGAATIGLNVGLLALFTGMVGLLAPTVFESAFADDRSFLYRQIQALTPGSRLMLGLGVAFLGPWIEEFVFRGLLFTRWARRYGLRAGILGSAAVFGALHFTTSPFTAFLIGIALAVLYVRTGSLWVTIAAHATNNGIIYGLTVLLGPDPAAVAAAPSTRADAAWLAVFGGLLVALVLPFYLRALRRWWPAADAPLPYDRGQPADRPLP